MVTLFAAQVCGSTGFSMTMAVGAIMAAAITGTNTWSGLPVAIGSLGTALASYPLSRLMARFGRRRPGLTLGYSLAVVGALLAMVGVVRQSFAVFLAGMALFGTAQTSNLLARYAAADITPGAQRGRAMGLIVWGSAAGSIVGPMLMASAIRVGDAIGVASVASAFLISVAGYALAAILVQALLRPDPLTIAHSLERQTDTARIARRRATGAILREPRVIVAYGTLMVSQFVMIGTTSTSPLYLHDHGHAVGTIGLAVAMHLGGMYVTSPLSGWLCDRFGRLPMIGAGGLVLLAALGLAGLPSGRAGAVVISGLFLNGVGWNLAFVSASALLTDALSPDERASIQGLADLVMGLMGAVGSALGGIVLGAWGFGMLNLLGAAMLLAPLIGSWLQREALRLRAAEPNPWAS
jgi:MFS family permease